MFWRLEQTFRGMVHGVIRQILSGVERRMTIFSIHKSGNIYPLGKSSMGGFRKEGREPGKGNKDIVFKRLKAEKAVKFKHEMAENGHKRRDKKQKILRH